MPRSLDIFVAAVLLILTLPLLILVSICIAFDDGIPILYRQKRVGLLNSEFELLKFRSMRLGADNHGFQTQNRDSRITRIGRIIRKLSIDELPQLINVLRGDMSLVGPRPNVPAQRELYSTNEWNKRHSVRPGITGLAQINGRSGIDEKTRTKLDLQYVETKSLSTDFEIILKTVKVITQG